MENPSEWKTAVDPTSGRTYWYHRKTRVSTWTRPNFIEVSVTSNDSMALSNAANAAATATANATAASATANATSAASTNANTATSYTTSANTNTYNNTYNNANNAAAASANGSSAAAVNNNYKETFNNNAMYSSQTAIIESQPIKQTQTQTQVPSYQTTQLQSLAQQQTQISTTLSISTPSSLLQQQQRHNQRMEQNTGETQPAFGQRSNSLSPNVNEPVRFILNEEDFVNVERLKHLLTSIISTESSNYQSLIRNVRKNPLIISDLTSAIIATRSVSTRNYAMQVLLQLSNIRVLACTAFHINQSWVKIFDKIERWTSVDGVSSGSNRTALVMFASLICQLIVGPTYSLITLNSAQRLEKELSVVLQLLVESSPASSSLTMLWEDLQLVTDEFSVRLYGVLSSKGHAIAAMLLLIISFSALHSEKAFTRLVKNGIVGSLQSVYISNGLDESLRGIAKQCLQSFMSCSHYVRDMLLDSLLNMSFEISQVALPMAVCPSIHSKVEMEDDEDTFQVMMESGCFEVTDLTPGETIFNNSFANRDIVWIPKSGVSWKLNSAVLWARCPALRELIQDFWNQGGGSLELSIDATDEVVYSVCQYIHGGSLNLPVPGAYQLELLRVASELGMDSFQQMIESSIGHLVCNENLQETLEFARSFGFMDLQRTCQQFLSGGKHPNPIRFDGSNNINNMSLEHEVLKSLTAVGEVLNSKPVPSVGHSISQNSGRDDAEEILNFRSQATQPIRKDSFTSVDSQSLPGTGTSQEIKRGSVSAASSSVAASKLKSGGIYSALLQGNKASGTEIPDSFNSKGGTKPNSNKPNEKVSKDKKAPHKTTLSVASSNDFDLSMELDMEVSGNGVPTEFNRGMSLKPTRPKTEAEKRLEEMSKPKHLRDTSKAKKSINPTEEGKSESELPEETESKPTPAVGKAKSTAPATKASTVAPTVEVKGIKRQVQQQNTFVDAEEPQSTSNSDVPTSSVRSSLTLLKTKTPKTRRRLMTATLNMHSTAVNGDENEQDMINLRGIDDESDEMTDGPRRGANRMDIPKFNLDYSEETTSSRPMSSNKTSLASQKPQQQKVVRRSSFDEEDQQSYDYDGTNRHDEDDDYYDHRSQRGQQRKPIRNNQLEQEFRDDVQNESRYPFEEEYDGADGPQEGSHECPDCGRHFAAEPFSRHVRICKKVFVNKRKVYDSSKKRIESIPELKSLHEVKKKSKQRNQPAEPPKSSKWKEQSLAFREAMRAARDYSNPTTAGSAVVERTPYVDPSLIQCPNCARRFNDKAAERHIPLCKNIIAKPSSLKKGSGSNATASATTNIKSAPITKKGWN